MIVCSKTEAMVNPFALVLILVLLPGLAIAFENRDSGHDLMLGDSSWVTDDQSFEYRLNVQPLAGEAQWGNITFSPRHVDSQNPAISSQVFNGSSFECRFGFLAPAARTLVGQARNFFGYPMTFLGLPAVQKHQESAEQVSQQSESLEWLWSQQPEESSLPLVDFSFKEVDVVHSFDKDLIYQMDLSWSW